MALGAGTDLDLEQMSDEDLVTLNRLLLEEGLYLLDEETNPNYECLFSAIKEQQFDLRGELKKGCWAGAMLEGSSRSGKTWSGVDIIIWLCLIHDPGCKINIYRSFFADFRDTLYDDFKRRLNDFGLPNPFERAETVKSFKINGSRISFIGCDRLGSKHGGGCDYAFFNECMHIPQPVFKQVTMRCRKFWWGDFNPSVTQHWVFDSVLTRPDVQHKLSTFNDNPHITYNERNEILITEPWEPGTYTVKEGKAYYMGAEITDKNQPPPHPTNITNGTSDEYHWKVYGLGLRGAMKGLIFKHVVYVDSLPEGLAYHYGLDFGFTVDPTALVRYAETETDIYIELLSYVPLETPEEINDLMEALCIEKELPITADSSDKHVSEKKGTIEMVSSLKGMGWKISKVSKTKSVMFWLTSMKKKRINIVKSSLWRHAKVEAENYRMREIHGIAVNQPIDKHNHMWDGARYAHMAANPTKKKYTTTKSPRNMGIHR